MDDNTTEGSAFEFVTIEYVQNAVEKLEIVNSKYGERGKKSLANIKKSIPAAIDYTKRPVMYDQEAHVLYVSSGLNYDVNKQLAELHHIHKKIIPARIALGSYINAESLKLLMELRQMLKQVYEEVDELLSLEDVQEAVKVHADPANEKSVFDVNYNGKLYSLTLENGRLHTADLEGESPFVKSEIKRLIDLWFARNKSSQLPGRLKKIES